MPEIENSKIDESAHPVMIELRRGPFGEHGKLMKILAECPICENRIEIVSGKIENGSYTCGLCKNPFDVKSNRIKPEKTPKIITPSQIPEEKEIDLPPALPVETAPAPNATLPPLPNQGDSFAVSPATKARANLKRRRNPVIPVLLGLATLASAGALIAVVVITDPFRKPPAENDEFAMVDEDTDAKSDETDETSDAADSSQENPNLGDERPIFRTNGKSDEVELTATNAPPDRPAKLPNNLIITQTESNKFWADNFDKMVRLRVNTENESHYVSGTIVDSRGWVATSLSAVAGADEIEVQSAHQKLDQLYGIKLLPTDVVRGVIKMDPGSDLVLLSINREFVPISPEVTLGKSTSLVTSEYIFQCACPGSKNWAWPKESQIEGRKTYDELDFDFKSQFDELKMDETNTFIMHGGYTDTSAGAGLFTRDGKLVGINTGLSDESKQVLAASVEKLSELISSSSNDPQALSVLKSAR